MGILNIKINKLKLLTMLLLVFSGCLKDQITPPVSVNLEGSAEILNYLESKGDYINSNEVPSIISAQKVNENLNDFLILDLRTPWQYSQGHIQGARNILSGSLINYLDTTNNKYSKVVLVSVTGQAAAYYNCLLRLYGFQNTYSLSFGMGGWNSDFSSLWLNSKHYEWMESSFDNVAFEKPQYSELPKISFSNPGASIEGRVKERIKELLNEEFVDSTSDEINSGPSMNFKDVYKTYNYTKQSFGGYFIMCCGTDAIFYLPHRGQLDLPGHPKGSILYFTGFPYFELRTTYSLQTIPNNPTILVYSKSGLISAYITAYLKLLGYNAKSSLFGAYWIADVFPVTERNNFPYIK